MEAPLYHHRTLCHLEEHPRQPKVSRESHGLTAVHEANEIMLISSMIIFALCLDVMNTHMLIHGIIVLLASLSRVTHSSSGLLIC